MDSKKKWGSAQSIIIMAIILLIFAYIGYDAIKVKPRMRTELQEVRIQYDSLSTFLDKKIPEIDSTLEVQSNQISRQGQEINMLNSRVNELANDDKDDKDLENPTTPSFE